MGVVGKLSLIVSVTPEGVIGRNNSLPWKLPSDLRRFKEITSNIGTVVMGRNTYDAIVERNGSILPNRHSIVLTRSPLPKMNCLETVTSMEEAVEVINRREHACVIGGTKIYELFMPMIDVAYITYVYANIEGDALFPKMKMSDWNFVGYLPRKLRDGDEYETALFVLKRKT